MINVMFSLHKPIFKSIDEIINIEDFENTEEQALFKKIFNKNHFANPLNRGDNWNYRKFIMVATQRTGTNLLVNLLRSHSNIVCYTELFKENNRPLWCFNRIDSETLTLSKKYPVPYLQHFFFRNYDNNVKAVGFKLMYNQLPAHKAKQVIHMLDKEKDVLVHVKRKNKLKTFTSMKLMEVNKKSVQLIDEENIASFLHKKPDSPYISSIYISASEWRQYIKKVQQQEQRFDRWIQDYHYLTVYYEDLENDYITEANKVIDALQLPSEELTCLNKKLNTLPLSQTIINYAELKKEFYGTAWECFFEE